ncbi:cilia- and flagella-associated protein 418-like [Daphnia carinata]|uniref:cilia- and flagella-associated protein 418-like n=1 Tax=Daphnia carinata TaxID=120202 RepID=UPI0028690A10|nr:cilia- and flagella-associated protein 418-like [Daphnia carinata]
MADDIEDLLREVEEKYLPRPFHSQQVKHSKQPIQPTTSAITSETHGDKDNQSAPIAVGVTGATGASRTTTRAHSSDIVCRELEDELSDLLDEAGGMSDAATVGLRCKRSPRRSASARELVGTKPITGDRLASTDKRHDFASSNKSGAGGFSLGNKAMLTGIRSAPPFVHHHSNVETRTTHVTIDAVVVEKQKCFPIYVSGVIDSIDTSHTVRVCTSLRCTGCDFRVSQFAHYRWRPGTDYLFLRNHMPEFDRVRVKLAAAKFCRAYACQCKFVTVKDLVDLNKLGHEFASTWICLGH